MIRLPSPAYAAAIVRGDTMSTDLTDLSQLDPTIIDLLAELPRSGTIWPVEARRIWLARLEAQLSLIYLKQPKGSMNTRASELISAGIAEAASRTANDNH
ncbi:hypothetical protein [Bradyrhizobium sp. USDA 4353]